MSQLRFIRNVLYQLKRRYPGAIDIMRRTSNAVDTATGRKTVDLRGVHVDRAIVLPSNVSRAALFDRTYIANDRDFAYGTNFDVTVRTFIIDRRDMPADFEITIGDYIVHERVRYNVQKSQKFEDDAGFIVLCKETLAEPPNLSLDLQVYDDLGIIVDVASFDPDFSSLEVHCGDVLLLDDRPNLMLEADASNQLDLQESINIEID